MKIEYVNQKGDLKMMQVESVQINMDGYYLNIGDGVGGETVAVRSKNGKETLFSHYLIDWVKKLKKGEGT